MLKILSLAFLLAQALNDLVRYNRKGDAVSSDISAYIQFQCTGSGSDRSCSSNLDAGEVQSQLVSSQGSDDPESPASYLEVGSQRALYNNVL
jgi:hypothetical protein